MRGGFGVGTVFARSEGDVVVQMKEEDLLRARYVGEAIKILQEATRVAYDPEEFLKVIPASWVEVFWCAEWNDVYYVVLSPSIEQRWLSRGDS